MRRHGRIGGTSGRVAIAVAAPAASSIGGGSSSSSSRGSGERGTRGGGGGVDLANALDEVVEPGVKLKDACIGGINVDKDVAEVIGPHHAVVPALET